VEQIEECSTVELEVGAVAHGGHCVARVPDGRVAFVRHALPGERVVAEITEVRGQFLRADAVRVLRASPDRVEPPCPYAGPDRCGGCDFQHATLSAQRELKAAVVREQLTRLAGMTAAEVDALGVRVAALPPVPGQPDGLGWRTRVQYTVDGAGRAGLLKHRSHEVVRVDSCPIAYPAVQAAPVTGRDWPDAERIEVVASGTGEVTVLVEGSGTSRVAHGPATVTETALGRSWNLPAQAFWQVHPAAAGVLAQAVVELLAPRTGERAWDLYGGAGIFAAALAPHLGGTGRITLVESDPSAVAAARASLADLTTITVDASRVERALARRSWRGVDLVVLDPPRSGAGPRVVDAILARSPRAVAYVACDPAAFARDVRAFAGSRWRLTRLRAFDLFPMTHHVECVGLLVPATQG
jgi:tRNA/tmRNA/rRNA uracil-C5-methylase (TrmA/RlmC/RlmD family)